MKHLVIKFFVLKLNKYSFYDYVRMHRMMQNISLDLFTHEINVSITCISLLSLILFITFTYLFPALLQKNLGSVFFNAFMPHKNAEAYHGSVLENNLQNSQEKNMSESFFQKRLLQRCFPVNIATFSRTAISQNVCVCLLQIVMYFFHGIVKSLRKN